MNLKTFEAFTQRLLDEVWSVLLAANKEYADEQDKLSNFRRIREALKRNPRMVDLMLSDVVRTFMAKHTDSIISGISIREPMRGRIVDLIGYAILLAAAEEEEGEPLDETYEPVPESEIFHLVREAKPEPSAPLCGFGYKHTGHYGAKDDDYFYYPGELP